MDRIIQRRQNRMRKKVARRGDAVAVNIADYFNAHLATPDLPLYRHFEAQAAVWCWHGFKDAVDGAVCERPKQGAALTRPRGAITLAGVDPLELLAALNPREADDDETVLHRLALFLIAGLKRRFRSHRA